MELMFRVLCLCSVDAECLGQSRAKSVCSFLQELNDAVNAKFVEESPLALIDTNPSFFSQFTVVIATQVCVYSYGKMQNQ
jgi:amyloid beta precursor protein binding protein 1